MKYRVCAAFAYMVGLPKKEVGTDKLRQKVVQLTLGTFPKPRPLSDNLSEGKVGKSCQSELQAITLMQYLQIPHTDRWTAYSAKHMMVALFNKKGRRKRERG